MINSALSFLAQIATSILVIVAGSISGAVAAQAGALDICPPAEICQVPSPQAAIGDSAPRDDPARWCRNVYSKPRFAAMTREAREHKISLCAVEQWRRTNM